MVERRLTPNQDVKQKSGSANSRQDGERTKSSMASMPTRPCTNDPRYAGHKRYSDRRSEIISSCLKRSTVLLRFPFVGEIVSCNRPDYANINNSLGERLIAHINEQSGVSQRNSMDDHGGKYCAFAIGGSPFGYSHRKLAWDRSVVQWILLDDLEESLTPKAYHTIRKTELESLDRGRLFTTLSAEWYVRAWMQKTGTSPKSLLRKDELLDHALEEVLSHSRHLEDLLRVLGAICTSPYYAIDDIGRQKAIKRFFQPSKWDLRVFVPNQSPETCRFYTEVWPLCGTVIQEYMNRARTVAIDLEAEGRRIWQYGWKNAVGIGLKSAPDDLSDSDLQSALKESYLNQKSPRIVGHKLLTWDILRLKERNLAFPAHSELWDTLIVAWILKPWEHSHALIVKKHGHKADIDAIKCYEVYEEQISALVQCFEGQARDIRNLVDGLFEDQVRLATIKNRKYPSDLHKKIGPAVLYPEIRICDVVWQQFCLVQYVTKEKRLKDPVMSPEICKRIAHESGDIGTKIVSVIVNDAAENMVQVRLSMLPLWLVDVTARRRLGEAHLDFDPAVDDDNWHRIFIAEDMFSQPQEVCSRVIREKDLSPVYAAEILRAWQTAYSRCLGEVEVRTTFPDAVEGRAGRSLLSVHDKIHGPAWLLYEPAGFGEPGASWHLLPQIPEGMGITVKKTSDQVLKTLVELPRWKDGTISNLDIDRLFVTPDTANRKLYLADIAHTVMNLLKAIPDGQILVCALRSPNEAAELQICLTQLSLSVLHSDSPLRQIERLRKEGLRAIACCYEDLSRYVEAAERFENNIRIVVDELPLHTWYASLHTPEEPNLMITQVESEVREGDDDEHFSSNRKIVTPSVQDPTIQITLKGRDIREMISFFLADWLRALLKSNDAPKLPVIILDSRLTTPSSSRSVGLSQVNMPFFPLEELLDDNGREIFHKVCFPRQPDKDIPNDYEIYRCFLRENWKPYKDFLPGTQRPAIEAIIKSRHDLLLRLPTGAGKSEVFQVPALLRAHYSERLTVVITPLRALMRDQVERLWHRHFRESVDYLSGGREAWINFDVYQGILDGRIKLLYVAPERFRIPRFTEALERRRRMDNGLEFVVFDEVHCVSEWGFEFRPDYLFAAQYICEWFRGKNLPGNPHRLLMTSATVTRRNQQDLERELGLQHGDYDDLPNDMPHPIQPFIVLESFDLPESDELASDSKFEKILEMLAKLDLSRSAALIFVRRREDCHRISEGLNSYAVSPDSSLVHLHSLPFHAGMPEGSKTEAVALLKAKAVNVLVCTKAFGMGMDIRHFHTCIHYRPPTFIEDYLQEVGRIGRGEEERQEAMRTADGKVTAILLFNHDNLEMNLGFLRDKAVKPPDLQDFFGYCLKHAMRFKLLGKAICILPSTIRFNEVKSFDENQVTNCLFWLERMKVIKVEGRHPPFLDLTLKISSLRKISSSETDTSALARALLSLIDETARVVNQPAAGSIGVDKQTAESAFGRFIRGLVRGVLALIYPVSPTPETKEAQPKIVLRSTSRTIDQDEVKVSVSMSELMAACGGFSTDDLYIHLVELSRIGAILIHKTFVFLRTAVPSTETFWDLLHYAVERLMRPTGIKVELLQRNVFEKELKDWYRDFLIRETSTEETSSVIEPSKRTAEVITKRLIQREVYRAMGTALKTIRYAGLEMKESLSKEGITQYARVVPSSSIADVQRGIRERLSAVRKLITELRNRDTHVAGGKVASFEVELVEIVDILGQEVRMSRLRELTNLVESSGFYGLENLTDEWVSVVSLNNLEPLPPYEPEMQNPHPSVEKPVPEDAFPVQAVYSEMLQKHELQVLRAQCMVLFAAMPTENRKQFIDQYFECLTANDLQGLLQDNVGHVPDEVLADNPMLASLRDDVRRERFSKELAELNDDQRAVCKADYSKRLLVNAGPGSGKTRVLMMRCAYLIHALHINPSEILVLAFNRAVVFEIRDRIRDLFRSLGYGNAIRKLNVSTFHSFALRHQETSDMYEEDAIGEAVHLFADRISREGEFAKTIAGAYKAILIDEFQDMNEDFYTVVKALTLHCQGGCMVIGDDDQDILTWNRKKWSEKHQKSCPLESVDYFEHYRKTFTPEGPTLYLNYRSVPEIVNRTHDMIMKASKNLRFSRMKAKINLKANRSESGTVILPFDTDTLGDIVREAMIQRCSNGKAETIAILCRSNRECRSVSERLVNTEMISSEQVELLGSEDFALYQLRSTGAMMDLCAKRDEWDFVEPFTWEDLLGEYEQLGHADVLRGIEDLKVIYQLIRLERGRPRMRDVVDFVQEFRASDVERLKAKTGLITQCAKITVSTVHKVKGLEYDTVVVMPSSERFPFNDSAGSMVKVADAAEEARICYVAMTRARSRLYVGWPECGREIAWSSCRYYAGTDQNGAVYLKGSPKEIYVSWPGQRTQIEAGLQEYIEKHIRVGDKIVLKNGIEMHHNGRRVGRLSEKAANAVQNSNLQIGLRVANVIRYSCGRYFEENHRNFWTKLHPSVQHQKWFYTVLVEAG